MDPETHTIMDANPIAEAMIGIPKEKLVDHVCHDFVCPAHCGQCPITDLHKTIENTKRILINAKGETVPILKTVARAPMKGKDYLIESFVDIRDQKKAEDRKIALIAYMSESVMRINKPLEITKNNLQIIAAHVKDGEYDDEDIRMQIQIQAYNIEKMVVNLEELAEKVSKEREEIPDEFRQFFYREVKLWQVPSKSIYRMTASFT
ncbi:MAG: PAS domain-containing protein [Methanoregula sp.]|nr:MAG: PAS domain-containing protein [Methanoregula sp.]